VLRAHGPFRAILHDESTYGPDTHTFNPDRFLTNDSQTLNPAIPHPHTAFGFGRRICPGQSLAELSIWLAIASILYSFNIKKPLDADGVPIEPSGSYSSAVPWYVVHKWRLTVLLICFFQAIQTPSNAISSLERHPYMK
jgi:hypothetical protein